MWRFLVTSFFAISCCCISLIARPDSLSTVDDDADGPRRKPNAEFIIGMQFSSLFYKAGTYETGFEINNRDTTISRNVLMLGYGGHVPLFNLGKTSTVWLVPAAILKIGIHNTSGSSTPDATYDLGLPVHFTAGIGGLRRRSNAWGIEGGVGANITAHLKDGLFSFVPSGIVDITYAPKSIFRLRLMADIFSYDLQPKDKPPFSQQTWSVSFVAGF